MADWTFRPTTPDDLERIADLKVLVIREHLERLRPWNEQSARDYLYERFVPANSRIIEVGGQFAGCVALRQAPDCRWIEQFYLYPDHQGHGIGSAVLTTLLEECDADGVVVRLDVLQGSPARRLYERHGFVFEHEDSLDIFMIRYPAS
ncbi:GNAT family N-acetyltransferase [Kineosporia mesophila]|uniref:GNAT family N-acetyltransferase n=1 Tax=Kineosporia mesophila TaxID=566012 RepID=A0ABP7AWB3_9ACTN|nr:GNAT family N-acetyltransferase [Kineosporia mesophila]MCD5354076.1 GNAT family N-acetyltransferase [Kineosporia mesophila]